MRVLLVSRYKEDFPSHIVPFVEEQGEALRAEGVEVDYFQVRGSYLSTSAIRTKIKSFRPDIIHAHYGLSAITAELQCKVPVVTTFHNGETLNKGVNFVSSAMSLRAAWCIYVAQHIYDKLYFKRKSRFSILPCGIDLAGCKVTPFEEARAALGFEEGKKYILFGGAFSNLRKNYPLLHEALALTGRNDVEVLEINGLSRAEVTLRMCACDLFALPTKSEGSPQALKEAMACGCPVLATDVADIKHLLGDLPGHYLCTFNPEEVALRLNEALSFGSRTEGRIRIIELGLTNDLVAKSLIDIYKQVFSE